MKAPEQLGAWSRGTGPEPDESPLAVGTAIAAVAAASAAVVVGPVLLVEAGFDVAWLAVVVGTVVCAAALLVLLAPGRRRSGRAATPAGEPRERLMGAPVVVVVALSVLVGIAVALTPLLTLPVLGVFALAVGVAAVLWFARDFPAGLLVLFVVRPALDQFKLGSDGAVWGDPSVLAGVVFLAAAAIWLVAASGRARRCASRARARRSPGSGWSAC
jgi:hypothetical protein